MDSLREKGTRPARGGTRRDAAPADSPAPQLARPQSLLLTTPSSTGIVDLMGPILMDDEASS